MAALNITEAKAYLNITTSASDAVLTGIIAAAEAAIGNKVGPLQPVTRTVRAAGGSTLILPSPIGDITAISDAGGSAVDVADLYVDQAAGVIYPTQGGYLGSGWYDVTYEHGHDPCPADLLLAVKELVRHLWTTQRGPSRRPGSTDSEATANTIPGAAYLLPFRVSELIAPYLQPGVA